MNYTVEEMLAVHLSHTFKDHEVGFTGLATGRDAAMYITSIPLAAMQLAKRKQAPNLTVLFCGWCINPQIELLDKMPESEFDSGLLNLPCDAQVETWPGPWSHHRGEVSFSFCSGVQVDIEGNINCTRIGQADKPKVALVGPILVPEHMAVFGREYIMIPHHEKRNFVDKVDHISGAGFPGGRANRKKLGLSGKGPIAVYTPKCIFGFDKSGRIYVQSIHPGVTEEELRDATGFDLGDLSCIPTTTEPTAEELRMLREEIDPKGILLG